MEIFRDPIRAGQSLSRPVIAMGNFDGVHLGHRKLFRTALELAQTIERPWAVVTFEPHPAKALAPDLAPQLITTLDDRIELISESGPAATVVLRFDQKLAALGPDEFVREILVEKLKLSAVVVGYDFTFGARRRGSADYLKQLGDDLGFEVLIVDPFAVGGIVVSSTKIRAFVLSGRVHAASLLLGRPLVLSGPVVKGDGRGMRLGFPTANIETHQELIPAPGVYAAWCSWNGWHYPAAVNVGSVPTFRTNGRTTVEAHIIDWAGDLYGEVINVEFVRRLRTEHRFDSAEELIEQVKRDVMRTRETLLKL